jgi:ADP-ribose pyrophosphatase
LAIKKFLRLIEKELSSKAVYRGKLLHVREDRVRLPNRHEATREYIVHPGAVMVIALLDNGQVLMERQFRYSLRKVFYELPAGKLDRGEKPLACARRELLEETGYVAKRWKKLATIYPAVGYSSETMHIFLATGLIHKGHNPDPDEFLEVLSMPLSRALAKVKTGGICEVKTIIGLLWANRIVRGVW